MVCKTSELEDGESYACCLGRNQEAERLIAKSLQTIMNISLNPD